MPENVHSNDRYYSEMHIKLIADEDDLVGLLAYGLYKREKLAYIKRFIKENNGRKPDNSELASFCKTAELHIDLYKEIAASRLNDITDTLYKEQLNAVIDEYNSKSVDIARNCKHKSWWYGFGQSIAASFLYTLALGAIIILLLYSQYGFLVLAKDILDKLVTQ